MAFELTDLNQTGLQLGLKLNNTLTNKIDEKKFREFVRDIKKEFPNKFQQIAMPDNKKGAVLFGKDDSRWIVIDENGLQYRENKELKGDFFNNVSIKLLEFFYDIEDVEPVDVSLVGKIFDYTIKVQKPGIDFIRRNLRVFLDEKLTGLKLRTTIEREDKLIHLNLEASENDDDDKKKILSLRVDINNSNQDSEVSKEQYKETLTYANAFVKDELITLLNNNFS